LEIIHTKISSIASSANKTSTTTLSSISLTLYRNFFYKKNNIKNVQHIFAKSDISSQSLTPQVPSSVAVMPSSEDLVRRLRDFIELSQEQERDGEGFLFRRSWPPSRIVIFA
jgi:hypothetical protein